MNGPIAQLVALAGHINAVVNGALPDSRFWPHNSTCIFCDRIRFSVQTKRVFRTKERTFKDPDEWVSWLADSGCNGAWIWHGGGDDPRISDRMSAGFVGGGGDWVLNTIMADGDSMSWSAAWDVWNQNAPNQKIWRVDYRHTANNSVAVKDTPMIKVADQLRGTLSEIRDFAHSIGADGFANCFDQAHKALSGNDINVHHKDLLPEPIYSAEAQRCIAACQSAWVFGGMGSWNDMGFEDSKQQEYERLSEACFYELISLIVAATNSAANIRLQTDGPHW